MTDRSKEVGYLYINGLGDGRTTLRDRVVAWWWKRAGLEIRHAHVDWYNNIGLEQKLDTITQQVDEMLTMFGGVALVGSSAGGSLAINAFDRSKDKNVCAINAHGRLKVGNYSDSHRMSLHHRAHLDGNKPSQSFYDSVTMAETVAIPSLDDQEKSRVMILTQFTDLVVPIETMHIEGVKTHRSMAFGHSGGFMAHLFADRDLIAQFTESQLKK